ncbi:putative DNA methylase [Anoxybacillus calidus]|jgi:putative DNA methylase|uniref:Putative DNA methylase n=1 Tax=[Anoxybacillus] calidus TaxID=575178 RepID=A0A7V9YYY0_9BACL|nr:DNA methyltransferase [Anoxybacillus calidus]MBA2871034.1 putative DNA methylase [Anoxybacillus calidus]
MLFNDIKISQSPQIAPLPSNVEPRLIDNGTLHLEASLAGNAERYTRGETSHTIHVWWARRPHSSMRALAFASLCKDTTSESYDLLKDLTERSDKSILDYTANLLKKQYSYPPKVLDMFGGGGTIPFEVANIGADSYSIDANELSVFIQKCNLYYSQEVDNKKIIGIVRESGYRILEQLRNESETLFPLRNSMERPPFGYFWTYSMNCQKCNYKFYLSKRRWLSKKKDKNIALLIENKTQEQVFTIGTVPGNTKFENETVWLGRTSSKLACPNCGELYENISIKDCNDEIVALVRPAEGKGKEFIDVVEDAIPSLEYMTNFEKRLLGELNIILPDSKLPKWSGIVNPALYGIETHSDFVNLRQRIILLLLIKALRNEYENLKSLQNESTAKYVIALLSSLIDQLVDWNCRLSMWISQNEQVGRAFCGPGVSMYWDYIEIDPVLNGPANLFGKLERIISGISSINKFQVKPKIYHAYAQKLPFEDNFFDAIVTDPPYYDNIYYTVLADFFYAWKRLALELIDEQLFSVKQTDTSHELVASKFRSNTAEQAHEDYCNQFSHAIKEAARVLKDDGTFSLVYSHSSINGWEAIVKAYRNSNLVITSIQPLSIERKQRPRAMTSEAVNTCITLVAHKSFDTKKPAKIAEVLEKIEEISNSFAKDLLDSGWSEEDVGLTVFANGVGMLANISKIEDTKDDNESLTLIAKKVHERFPKFSVKNRKSL